MIHKAHPHILERAATMLVDGGLVAFPTETVYGLGADATNESAVEKIYSVKHRPSHNPLIVHIPDRNRLSQVISGRLTNFQHKALEKLQPFWPGPLTLVLPKSDCIAPNVTAGLHSVGVRIPHHKIALELLRRAGLPLAAPSANRSNYISPTTAEHVADCLGESVDMIINGGVCKVGIESTVLSLLNDTPTLLRPGAVTPEMLTECLGQEVATLIREEKRSVLPPVKASLSPGQQDLHYSPKTPLRLATEVIKEHLPKNYATIVFSKDKKQSPLSQKARVVSSLSVNGDLTASSRNLYSTLRALDKGHHDMIIIDSCEESELGLAVMDRIRRATHE